MSNEITGGCLCGASRYTSSDTPIDIRACHCRICQRATGAPFYARVRVPLDQVTMSGPIGWYNSSESLRRGFCTQCGTTLFSERAAANSIGLTFGSLDEPDRFAPADQIWTSAKMHWVELGDAIPAFPEFPPA